MATELPRPLHRLTPLRDDPAAVWLSRAQRLVVRMLGWRKWATWGLGIWLFRLMTTLLLLYLIYYPGYLPWILTCAVAAATFNPMRRAVLRSQNARISELIRTSPPPEALKVEDWAELEPEPDGRLVSVVGWVRARVQMSVAGEQCVGLVLPCQQRYPGVMASVHDFDLVDEQERPLAIQVADSRVFGPANMTLSDGHQRRTLVSSMDLPVGAVLAGWDTFVLRDGDPVMVLGFKQTVADPVQHAARQVPLRVTVASAADQPLLIFALDAERRPAPARPVPASFNWG
jgi:hypothetical protein